jgi:PIN domain nuclease of toxin-antitoxin system
LRVLLDTHAFLWQADPKGRQLGKKSKRLLQEAEVVYVSAISVAELHIKSTLGKLAVREDLSSAIVEVGDVPLPFSTQAADALQHLLALSRHDPFDRMLVAQAEAERLTLLTGDSVLLELELPYVMDARI